MTHGVIENSITLAGPLSSAPQTPAINVKPSYTYYFASDLPTYASGFDTHASAFANSSTHYLTSSLNFDDIGTVAETPTGQSLTNINSVANVNFSYLNSDDADIVIYGLNIPLYELNSTGLLGGYTNLPRQDLLDPDSEIWSDVVITPNPNLSLAQKLAHELNHAVGLSDVADAGFSGSENSTQFTMMSKNVHPQEGRLSPELQLYDVASLQALYGQSVHNDGNTVYSSFSDGNGDNRMYAIWDSGGTDTIDASGETTAALIDLRPGYFSSIGPFSTVSASTSGGVATLTFAGSENISIGFGAYIENATGTSDNDLLIGNILSNSLHGRGGNDILYGDESVNTLHDAGDPDYRQISSISLNHLAPESLQVSEAYGYQVDQLYGDGGNDIIHGGLGYDHLYGGDGDDHLYGGDADDIIHGNDGTDVIDGGEGTDLASYADSTSAIVVDFSGTLGAAGDAGSDTLVNIEGIIATEFDDTLIGGENYNLFYGLGGNDTVTSGVGGMLAVGGDGNDTLISETSDSLMDGGEGNDLLTGTGSLNNFDGGNGFDWLQLFNASGVNNYLHGGEGADKIEVSSTAEIETIPFVFGGGGNDVIDARSFVGSTYYSKVTVQLGLGDGNDVALSTDADPNSLIYSYQQTVPNTVGQYLFDLTQFSKSDVAEVIWNALATDFELGSINPGEIPDNEILYGDLAIVMQTGESILIEKVVGSQMYWANRNNGLRDSQADMLSVGFDLLTVEFSDGMLTSDDFFGSNPIAISIGPVSAYKSAVEEFENGWNPPPVPRSQNFADIGALQLVQAMSSFDVQTTIGEMAFETGFDERFPVWQMRAGSESQFDIRLA